MVLLTRLLIFTVSCLVFDHIITDSSLAYQKRIPIHILLLLPKNETYKFSLSKILPSLNMAIEELKKTDYASSFDISLTGDSCDCNGILAPVNAMENIYGKRNHKIHFNSIFGPMCD